MAFAPLVLKQMMLECDISQPALRNRIAALLGREISRPTVNLCVNRGYVPKTIDGFVAAVDKIVTTDAACSAWLERHGLTVADIWRKQGREMRHAKARGHGRRVRLGIKTGISHSQLTGDPTEITITREVEMITTAALRHFKLFRNPFIDDIQKDADVYMSDEHRYIEAAMLDAAMHGGFLAVIGEVGSGKSVMRRKVAETLKRDGGTMVIFPQMIDKGRLNASSICDAIVMDVSSERPRIRLEDKTRQVQRLLLDRAKSGFRACLIIEEAHDLKVQTLKYLKRFYELEDGYKKLLGIVLIGQTELKHMFNEAQNVDMREVIRRVQVAEIRGLNGHLHDYLEVKFKRVGGKLEDIFAEDAYAALGKRLTSKSRDGKSTISHAYPLTVNNYIARAMNYACETGEAKVSAEVIDAI
ncbi:ExeA family protein [Desulfobulbus elongatus]|uniref:ExeA family protein n=1 Tax=Desulfobulbus elongatus TaxID=53332 RepID=UPI000A75FD82|nr:AAA family ATPase [Desulfobulbus elongatus]